MSRTVTKVAELKLQYFTSAIILLLFLSCLRYSGRKPANPADRTGAPPALISQIARRSDQPNRSRRETDQSPAGFKKVDIGRWFVSQWIVVGFTQGLFKKEETR